MPWLSWSIIRRVETFGEPAVERIEEIAGLPALPWSRPEARGTGGSASQNLAARRSVEIGEPLAALRVGIQVDEDLHGHRPSCDRLHHKIGVDCGALRATLHVGTGHGRQFIWIEGGM
jgi:hypothetical protein